MVQLRQRVARLHPVIKPALRQGSQHLRAAMSSGCSEQWDGVCRCGQITHVASSRHNSPDLHISVHMQRYQMQSCEIFV